MRRPEDAVVLARRPRRGRAARPPGGGVRGAGGHRPVRTAARPRRMAEAVFARLRDRRWARTPCGACEPCTSSGPSTCCAAAVWTASSRPVSWPWRSERSTVAVLDVQISAARRRRPRAEPRRGAPATELARRYRLGAPLAAALAFEAVAHARAGRRTELERCLAEASEHGDRDFDVIAEFARVLLGSWRRTGPPPAATSSGPRSRCRRRPATRPPDRRRGSGPRARGRRRRHGPLARA